MPRVPSFATIAVALALGLPLVSCAAVQGRETAGQYAGDADVTTRVKAEIVKAQSLKGFEIHVETMQGTVQLSGFVDTRAQKDQAGQIAQGVEGVTAVRDNILVKGGQ
ncbi:MAG TPA: BON domain-containing protein [Stellaceae bacterium]|nr:BON domain-containing protein [Stellaceae bacterium]